jgi:hypothetical protein
MHKTIRTMTLGLTFAAMTNFSDHAFARNAVETALHKAEKNLCKILKAKSCAHAKPKQHSDNPAIPLATPAQPPTPIVVNPKPPLPRDKPPAPEPIPPDPTLAEKPIVPPPPKPEMPKPEMPKPIVLPPAEDAGPCLVTLTKLNVTFTPNPSYDQQDSCVIANPVQLKSFVLNGQKLSLPDQPILNCAFAVQFTTFIQDSAGPMIANLAASPVAKLYTGPGFVCRGRNGDSAAKLSEHALGNAVDIEQIQLADGRTLQVKDAGAPDSKDYTVLNAIRHSACTYFTTVLGPGSNAAHASHFHFDSEKRGKSGTYRICE